MTLFKIKKRNDYTDFYLGWVFDGKKYFVRVKPVFAHDLDKFYANSVDVPNGDDLNKYL